MNRRQFLGGIAGTLLFPSRALAQDGAATPAATPQHSGRPRPHVLGDGIELIDYRIYPSNDVRRVIGEIWNTRDDMVDAPVVSMTFPDVDELGGFAYASPFMPVLRPGESTMIFGVLPNEVETRQRLESAEFGLCGPVGPGEWSARYEPVDLSVYSTVLQARPTSLRVDGRVSNLGHEMVGMTRVRGLVRDHYGRYTGCTTTALTQNINVESGLDFTLLAGEGAKVVADPFLLLNRTTDYSVDVIPGLVGPLTAPGCATGYPWS